MSRPIPATIITAIVCLLAATPAGAHSGGLDARGGHTNHATGEYHCHADDCTLPDGERDNHDAAADPRDYDRDAYLPRWADSDGDCRNTRHEVLVRDSDGPVLFESDAGCRVLSGRWEGAYGGEMFSDSGEVHVDHLVPLSEAHRSGAWRWSENRKRRFANDMRNLVVADAGLNMSKGDRDPAEWRPPDRSAWCEYAREWRAIKRFYALAIDPAEARALREMTTTCPMEDR